jgi:SAM-dependent methyltransferase
LDTTDPTRQIDKWNQRYGLKDAAWSLEPNHFLVQELSGLAPGKALDLGAGEGRHAIWLAQNNWQVTAIDFAAKGIDRGKIMAARQHVQVEWVCADLSSFPLPTANFDLVIMLYLHIPGTERKAILGKAVNSLLPGGHFIYIGHDPRNIDEGQGGPQSPEVLCSAEELVADLDGFHVLVAQTRQRMVDHEKGHGESTRGFALDTVVHAVKPAIRHVPDGN